MASREKLIKSIRENAKNVRYADACKVAGGLGFTGKGQSGSHNAFSRPGEMTLLNFQNRDGKIKPYQAAATPSLMIEKYWTDNQDETSTADDGKKPERNKKSERKSDRSQTISMPKSFSAMKTRGSLR